MLSLLENLQGKDCAAYISAHQQIADTFSLTKNGWSTAGETNDSTRILNELSPYHIRTIHTNRWFCYCVPPGYSIEIYLFQFTNKSKDILIANYNSIFYNDAVWHTPEDLCFFKGSTLISGSVSHENIFFVYNENLQLPGLWEKKPSVLAEQISIPE